MTPNHIEDSETSGLRCRTLRAVRHPMCGQRPSEPPQGETELRVSPAVKQIYILVYIYQVDVLKYMEENELT